MKSIKKVAEDIWNTYQVSLPIYHNKTKLYHCKIPIYPEYPKLYEALVFIRQKNNELYKEIECITNQKISQGDIALIITSLGNFVEASPDEYKPSLRLFLGIMILAYLRNKHHQP